MHENDGRVVSNFVVQALRNQPITIYGEGEQTRSFCYCSDLIEGFLRLMASPHGADPVNLGNPRETTVRELAELTRRLIPAGTHVRIEQDPALDQVDRYSRKLAYVWKGGEDVNVTLVRQGAAGVWFFDGREGRHADELLRAVERARAGRKGLWGACPLARFDPLDSMSSGPAN